MGRIEIKRIEFHSAGANYNYVGSEGYRIGDRGGISVTFQVNEGDGSYVQLTEAFEGPFPNYDAAIDHAYNLLERRLEGFAKTADGLRQRRERLQSQSEA